VKATSVRVIHKKDGKIASKNTEANRPTAVSRIRALFTDTTFIAEDSSKRSKQGK